MALWKCHSLHLDTLSLSLSFNLERYYIRDKGSESEIRWIYSQPHYPLASTLRQLTMSQRSHLKNRDNRDNITHFYSCCIIELTYAQCLKRALPHRLHSVNINLIIRNDIFLNFLSILSIVSWSPLWVLIPSSISYNNYPFSFCSTHSPYKISFSPTFIHIQKVKASPTSSWTSFMSSKLSPHLITA